MAPDLSGAMVKTFFRNENYGALLTPIRTYYLTARNRHF